MAVADQLEEMEGSGQKLKHAREAAGLTVAEVSESLKIKADFVDALEAEDTSRLPAAAFVYGYLRSYAKLVDLPSDEIVEGFPRIQESKPPLSTVKSSYAQPPANRFTVHNPTLIYGGIGAGVLIAVFALWQAMVGPDSPSTPTDTTAVTPASPTESERTEAVVNAPASGTTSTSSSSTTETVSPPSDGTKPSTAAPSGKPAQSSTVQAAPATATTTAPPAPTAPNAVSGPKVLLELAFSGECWAEVVDANGRRLIYELGQAGRVLSVEGVAPLVMTLGKAPNVSVKFNGKTVDVVSGRRSEYVKMTLGDTD